MRDLHTLGGSLAAPKKRKPVGQPGRARWRKLLFGCGGALPVLLSACGQTDLSSLTLYESRDLSAASSQILLLTNQIRRQGLTCQGVGYPPSPALLEDKTLSAAAQHRAEDLALTGDFSHTPADGKTYSYWLSRVHFFVEFPAAVATGENLGMAVNVQEVMNAWKDSTFGHCEAQFTGIYLRSGDRAVMPGFSRIGLGEAIGANGNHYWVAMFAG
ncbi:CAP domain-containing protein [Deinococcus sp.]|uniref:CAP domain-containing protein n=1 Tax=Deinococcus sp. TaxID=47478 RepID=UPI003CC66437